MVQRDTERKTAFAAYAPVGRFEADGAAKYAGKRIEPPYRSGRSEDNTS